jgi:DNA-binding MarR family transcriptional regulator
MIMQSDAANLETEIDLPHRELVDRSLQFATEFQRWLGGSGAGGLSYARLRLLEVLHCQGPARMKDLADELHLSARNMTTVADALETDGLVRRVPHPTDRRATLLELTAAGLAAASKSLEPRLTEMSRLFDALTAAERRAMLRSLDKLLCAMAVKAEPEPA